MKTLIADEMKSSIVEYYNLGNTMQNTADRHKISLTTVFNVLKSRQVYRRPVQKKSDEELLEYFNSLDGSVSISKATAFLGISATQFQFHFLRLMNRSYAKLDKRKNRINDLVFQDLSEDSAAWLLGWIWSDGTVHNIRNSMRINYHYKDLELTANFREIVGGQDYVSKNCRTFSFCSKQIKADLGRVGCGPRKSLTIMMPRDCESLNYPAFFRGLFEGDGWVTQKHGGRHLEVGISSGNPLFLEQIIEFLQKYGMDSYYRKRSGAGYGVSYSLRFRGTANCVKFLSWIYPGTEKHFLSRKRNKFLAWKKNT